MSAIFTSFLRRAVSAAIVLTILTAAPSKADWEKLAGKGKVPASGKLKTTVNNVILGTVTGDTTAKS